MDLLILILIWTVFWTGIGIMHILFKILQAINQSIMEWRMFIKMMENEKNKS